jgi:hypothetical protein
MKDSVFREIPSREQVLEWLQRLQITDFNDSHAITEKTFLFEEFNSVLLELEPYYYPCKAQIYLHRNINMKRAMTVLRQLVKVHGYTFFTRERLIAGEKINEYFLGLESYVPSSPLKISTINFF